MLERARDARPQLLGNATMQVVVADIDGDAASAAAAALAADGVAAVSCAGDVGTRAGAEAMVHAAVRSYGGVDILVANAGIVKAAPFLEMTEEVSRQSCRASAGRVSVDRHTQDFDEVLRVNLKGVFLVRITAVVTAKCCGSMQLTRLFHRQVKQQRGRWSFRTQRHLDAEAASSPCQGPRTTFSPCLPCIFSLLCCLA